MCNSVTSGLYVHQDPQAEVERKRKEFETNFYERIAEALCFNLEEAGMPTTGHPFYGKVLKGESQDIRDYFKLARLFGLELEVSDSHFSFTPITP